MTQREVPAGRAARIAAAQSPARPDPRGPVELEAGRRLEEAWNARRRAAERAARLKAAAPFWEAVEAKRGAASGGAVETVTRITARRGRLPHSGNTSGGTRP